MPDMSRVPIVREEFPGVLPERQVEFHIDLVRGAAPIAKAPYVTSLFSRPEKPIFIYAL